MPLRRAGSEVEDSRKERWFAEADPEQLPLSCRAGEELGEEVARPPQEELRHSEVAWSA
jgi:hypothetical protein